MQIINHYSQATNNNQKIITKILQSVKTTNNKYFTKKCLSRFLYTFSFEVGCNLPTDLEIKSIYLTIENPKTGYIQTESFLLMVKFSREIYTQSKKDSIGGIFDRLIIKLKNHKLFQVQSNDNEML